MAILFFILKLIGFVLLTLILLLILLLGCALFVPVRYFAEGEYSQKILAKARFSWLFRIIYVTVLYEGKEPVFCVRLFGIPVYPRRKKEKKAKKKEKKQKKSLPKKKEPVKQIKQVEDKKVEQKEVEQKEPKLLDEPDKPILPETTEQEEEKLLEQEPQELLEPEKEIKEKANPFAFLKKIRQIKEIPGKIKESFFRLISFFKKLQKRGELILEFLQDANTKAVWTLFFGQFGRVLSHLRPKKFSGFVRFGTGDPYSMGQCLAILGIFYGFYGEHITIKPEWDEKVIEGNVKMKGRIRFFTLLRICIKVYLDKDTKLIRKRMKQLKEEL